MKNGIVRTVLAISVLAFIATASVLAQDKVPAASNAAPAGTLDSIVNPTAKSTLAILAEVTVDLRIAPQVTSSPSIAFEIILVNAGGRAFWAPSDLAVHPGTLEVLWRFNGGVVTTRRVLPPAEFGDAFEKWVYLPRGSYFGRHLGLDFVERGRPNWGNEKGRTNAAWPVGHYDFRVRMSWADGEPESGVPGGVFESNIVHVEITP